jgi:hypothetical protein
VSEVRVDVITIAMAELNEWRAEARRLRAIEARLDEAIEHTFPHGTLDHVALVDIRDGAS